MPQPESMTERVTVDRSVSVLTVSLPPFGMASSDLEQVFMKLVGESEQKMEKAKGGFRIPMPKLAFLRKEKEGKK